MRPPDALPDWLPRSAAVDLRALRSKVRPAVRTRVAAGTPPSRVRRWARANGWYAVTDADGYLVLSARGDLARRVMTVDRTHEAHVDRMGALLGYPVCCRRAAARVTEQGLDAWSQRQARRRFIGRYKRIDHAGYLSGSSLISHVPCSTSCAASLRLALPPRAAP